MINKVYIASDHTGFEVKSKIKVFLETEGYQIEDCGAYQINPADDYPELIGAAAEKVSNDPESCGIVVGGSGQGEAMVANKYPNVRCALFYSTASPVRVVDVTGRQSEDPFEILKLTRDHNHANMLSIGVRFLTDEDVLKAIKVWLETPYSSDERHVRRVEKIRKVESSILSS